MTDFTQLFRRLLPGIYRTKDETRGELQQFLQIMAQPPGELEQSIGQLYLDLFVESCRPEFLSLIGDLIGAQVDPADPASVQRATLATTFAFYRSKGRALPLARVVEAVSTWTTVTVDFSQVVARVPFIEALDVVVRQRALPAAEDSPGSGRFFFNVADQPGQTVTPLYDELRGRPIRRAEIATLASEVVGTDFGFNIYDRAVPLVGPGAPVPLAAVPADLTDFANPKNPDGTALTVVANQVAVDPALGRFLIVSPKPLAGNTTVDFHQLLPGATAVQTFDLRDSARMAQLGRSDDPAPYTLDLRSAERPTDLIGRTHYDHHGFFMTVGSTVANQRPNPLQAGAFTGFSFDSRPLAQGDVVGNVLQLQDGIDGSPLTRRKLAGHEATFFDAMRGFTIHELAVSLRDPAFPVAVTLRAADLGDFGSPLDVDGNPLTLASHDVAIDPQLGRFLLNLTALGLLADHLRVGYLLAPRARSSGVKAKALGAAPSVYSFAADGAINPLRDDFDGTLISQKLRLTGQLADFHGTARGYRVKRNGSDVTGALAPHLRFLPAATAAAPPGQLDLDLDRGRFAFPAGFLQPNDVVTVDFSAEDLAATDRTFARVDQRMPRMMPAGVRPVLIDTRRTRAFKLPVVLNLNT